MDVIRRKSWSPRPGTEQARVLEGALEEEI
jgi:hypothetical protein